MGPVGVLLKLLTIYCCLPICWNKGLDPQKPHLLSTFTQQKTPYIMTRRRAMFDRSVDQTGKGIATLRLKPQDQRL